MLRIQFNNPKIMEVNGMKENTKVIALDVWHYKYAAGKRIPKTARPERNNKCKYNKVNETFILS